jgi:hypothetical protein
MHTRRVVVAVVALCVLFVSVWMLPDAAASEGAREPARPLAEMTLSASRIDWLPVGGSERLVLTVAGPEGLWLRREFEAGQPASLSLSGPEWEHLPDGTYTWELRVISPSGKQPQRSLVESGHFFVKDGGFVPARKKASVAPPRPPRLITAESTFIDGDLSVKGNACIGTSCTTNDPDPNLPSLILKGPQPHIRFDDQFVEGGSTPHDWAILINPFSAAEFSIGDVEDTESPLIPFTIAGGAPNSSIYVASNGNVGLGTATPAQELHIFENADTGTRILIENPNTGLSTSSALTVRSDSAVADFKAHGSGRTTVSRFGQTLAGWGEFATYSGNGLAVGTANDKPLILGTNDANRVHITAAGNIGIGTTTPANRLHVFGNAGTNKVLIQEANGTTTARELLEIRNNGAAAFILEDTSVTERWGVGTFASSLVMDNQAATGLEFSFSPTGNLTITGTLTQGSDRDTKRDIVPVQPEEVLAKVMALPITTWNRKTDDPAIRHMGPMAQDFAATFGLGDDDRHIAVLDIAGVSLASVQALHRMVAEKDAEIATLQQRLTALEELVAKLAAPQQP